MKKYQHVGLGGTFDRLHSGHKSLIDLAFAIAHRVSLGIARKICSKDKFLAKNIESYVIRQRAVEDYLKSKKLLDRALLFPLDDIYGTAKTEKMLEAIVVSKETRPNALKINQLRKQKNLPPLKIIVAPYVLGDNEKIITSGRIRAGEIDRKGNSYQLSVFSNQKEKLILPEYLREELRKPLGQVILGDENQLEETAKKTLQLINILKSTMVISVGDVITTSLLKVGFDPDVKIIDFRVRRKPIQDLRSVLKVPKKYELNAAASKSYFNLPLNLPGTVNLKTTKVMKKKIKEAICHQKKSWIVVKGEEDLLTLPAILLAPLQSLVLYGQMDLGVILVEVTGEKKKEVEKIMQKFV